LGSRRQVVAGRRVRQASYTADCDVNKEGVVVRCSSAVRNSR